MIYSTTNSHARLLAAAVAALALLIAIGATAQGSGATARPTWGLFMDVGDPAGAAPRPSADAAISAFAARVESYMGVPSDRLVVVTGERLSREDVRRHIAALAARVEPGGMALLHLRAYVTKPATESAMYVYPGDGDLAAPPPADPRPIRDTELVDWLKAFPPDTSVALFLDVRTVDESLMVYFGARATVGDASVATIARSDKREPMAATLAALLTDDTDTNADAALGVHELGVAYQARIYETGVTSADAISGLTGEATRLYLLPSAIMINGPLGSHAVVDGRDVGDVPFRFAPGALGSHEVEIYQSGYRRPEPRTIEITTALGEARAANFPLQRVAIGGTVTAAPAATVGELLIGVLPDAGLVARLDGPGAYDLDVDEMRLQAGVEYRVIAATPDERHFGSASFTYDGHEDIVLDIALEERTLWDVADIYHGKGFAEEALQTAFAARATDLDVPVDLDTSFVTTLLEAWSGETDDARAMIVCARMTERAYSVGEARGYWRLAKAAAGRGTDERQIAVAGYKASGGDLLPYAIAGLCLLGASGAVAAVRRRKRST